MTVKTYEPIMGCMSKEHYQLVSNPLDDEEDVWVSHEPGVPESPYECAEVYPEAASSVRQLIKEAKAKILSLMEKRQCYMNAKISSNARWALTAFYVESPINELNERIEWWEKFLYFVRAGKNVGKGADLKVNIEKAKEVPIPHFIKFNGAGFAPCLWHSEKTGSMKYYAKGNRVWCYGACGRGGDVIDVVMQLRGVKFLDAVNFILNK